MTILLSPRSGRASRSARDFLFAFFRSRGIEPVIREPPTGIEATRFAREAVATGEKTIVAGGGDGTISAIASALVGTDSALGVLPLGTLNHFAKDIGVPAELDDAAQVLMTGRIASIDAGEVNGRTFLNNSSLGLYPAIVFEREKRRGRGWNKWVAMAWASLSVFHHFPALDVRLELAGRRMAGSTPFVFIGNNEYEVEGFKLGSRASLDRGRLWVLIGPHRSSRWRLVRLMVRAFFGRVRQDRDFQAFTAGEVWIETRSRRLRVALDGEVVAMNPPLHYRSLPRALRVIVPAGTA